MTDGLTVSERRVGIAADISAQSGNTEALPDRLVRSFCGRIGKDAVLGPIFRHCIMGWESRLQQMARFWSSVTLMSGSYHGKPMARHKDIPVNATHFTRWLALFGQAVREVCPPSTHTHCIDRAHRIARSLSMGLAEQARGPAAPTILSRSGAHR